MRIRAVLDGHLRRSRSPAGIDRERLEDPAEVVVVDDATSAAADLADAGITLRGVLGVRQTVQALLGGLAPEEAGLDGGDPVGSALERLGEDDLARVEALVVEARRAGVLLGARSLSEMAAVAERVRRTGIPVDPVVWRRTTFRALAASARAAAVGDQSTEARQAYGLAGWASARLAKHAATWRLSPGYLAPSAVTGRLVAREPNVLAMPRQLRAAIVAPSGVIVAADWSGQEPAILAALARDEALASALASGRLYDTLAKRAGVSRPVAKAALLATFYGAGNDRLEGLGITDPLRWRAEVTRRFPAAAAFRRGAKGEPPAPSGFATWPEGVLSWRTGPLRRLAPKAGAWVANAPVQATGALMLSRALVRAEMLLASSGELVGAFHDELLVNGDPDSARVISAAMRSAAEMTIGESASALAVKIAQGKSWAKAA